MWRYLVFGILFVGFYLLGAHLHIAKVIEFSKFIHALQNTVSTFGYIKALLIYSQPIATLSTLRTLFGFVITYVVFIFVAKLQYNNFKLIIDGPVSTLKGILYLSWAFYWRMLSSFIMIFLISLFVIKPAWWLSHLILLMTGYMGLLFMIILLVLNRVINKSTHRYCHLETTKNIDHKSQRS